MMLMVCREEERCGPGTDMQSERRRRRTSHRFPDPRRVYQMVQISREARRIDFAVWKTEAFASYMRLASSRFTSSCVVSMFG